MGPISFGYCCECALKPAEPEFLFAMTFEDCGIEVAEWVKDIWTWRDGAYVSWSDYAASAIAAGARSGETNEDLARSEGRQSGAEGNRPTSSSTPQDQPGASQ
jgi:hypothetical protein